MEPTTNGGTMVDSDTYPVCGFYEDTGDTYPVCDVCHAIGGLRDADKKCRECAERIDE